LNTISPPDEYRSVPGLIEDRARELGDSSLLQFKDRTWSYAEINDDANRMANALLDLGVREGDKVSVFMRNSPEYLSLWFAIAKIGAIMVPINVDHKGDTLEYILRDSGAGTIVIDESTRQNYATVRDEFQREFMELTLGETKGARYRRFDDVFSDFPDTPLDSTSAAPGDPMGIIYTSGSTGQPKGVVLPHYSYVNTGWEFSKNVLSLDESDRLFTTLPLFHCNAQQTTVMGAIFAKTDFILKSGFTPESFWKQIRTHDVTVFNYIGSMIPLLHNMDERPEDHDNPVQYGIGAAAPVEMMEAFEARFDLTLLEGYGLTETATVAAVNYPGSRRIGSIGESLSYMDVDIVDRNDEPLSPGETGEIVVRPTRPNTMMKRYHGRPEETVEAWQNLWYHTGDLGYKDEDGYLYFIDRKEYAIKKQEETISSFEIERMINQTPDIQEVSVFGVQSKRGNEDIKAVVVPSGNVSLTPVDVIKHCENYLPYFKLPRYVELVDELPKTPTERVKKYKLKQKGNSEAWDRENGYELMS
jgi:acyl-CoA synthetase (AMP-forming)/AMP-acid ligase II